MGKLFMLRSLEGNSFKDAVPAQPAARGWEQNVARGSAGPARRGRSRWFRGPSWPGNLCICGSKILLCKPEKFTQPKFRGLLHQLELMDGSSTHSCFQRLDNMIQMKHFGQRKKYSVVFLYYSHSFFFFFFSLNSDCAVCNIFSYVRICQGRALPGQLRCEKLRGLPHSINLFWFHR